MKKQFMQIQTFQEKGAPGEVQSSAPSQPENTATYPKKTGSGLLSGYNTTVNNAQSSQVSSKPTPLGSIGLPQHSPQAPGTETGKQNPPPPLFKGRNGVFAPRIAMPNEQRSIQNLPNIFASRNVPQQPAQVMPAQTHSAPNFDQSRGYVGTPPITGALNNPGLPIAPAPAPVMPNAYPNTGNLALKNFPGEINAARSPHYPAGATPYTGFSPFMQPIPGMHPPYSQYGQPSPKSKKRRFPIWARIVTSLTAFILLISGGLFAYYQVEIAPSLNNIIGRSAIHSSLTSSKNGTPVATVDTQSSSLSSQERINILLLGSDTDGKNTAPLAQSDIVVTIDQKTHYVGMLSIPRDLQVSIPNSGAGKMDFAFSYGWQDQGGNDTTADAEAGAGLAEDTIQENFGIHIDRYAWVGLAGFVKVIDTAGGVDIDVTHPMVDDDYPDDVSNSSGNVYDYQRLYIAPGPQHLNGTQALDYVRTRHSDLIGDFGRSARQQQVLSALKTKLAAPDTISQTPQLLNDLNGYLLTDMQLDDLALLGTLARNVDLNSVQHLTLSPPYSTPSSVNTNYLPICSQITPAISQMFGIQANCIPQSSGSAGLASIIRPAPQSNSAITSQGATQNSQQFSSQIPGPDLSSLDITGGVHTLLDVMFMTVFESFNAIKI